MFKLKWDQTGERFYETGTKNGVLFKKTSAGQYGPGVAWNGLTAVTESPSGAEENPIYADDSKYLSLYSAEDFGGTIQAYTYPDEWAECDGSAEPVPGLTIGQQPHRGFGLAYRTVLGNDSVGESYGYKLHLVYGATASPSEKGYTSINDSPDAVEFSWEFTTTPVAVSGYKPTALLVINSTKVDPAKLATIESILYGTAAEEATATTEATEAIEPRLPMPSEIIEILGTDGAVTGGETGANNQG